MREKLKKKVYERGRYKGEFEKYGLKSAYKGLQPITILLRDVRSIAGSPMTDHLWLNLTKGFEALGLFYPGDIIAFDARVYPYEKGYVSRDEDLRETDYKLSYPSKTAFILKVERDEGFYTICPQCKFPSVTQRVERDDFHRCRRCSFTLKGEIPESWKPEPSPKLEQTTLGVEE